jgi:hypothetical protein
MKHTLNSIEPIGHRYLSMMIDKAPMTIAHRLGLIQPKFDMNSPRTLLACWLMESLSEKQLSEYDEKVDIILGNIGVERLSITDFEDFKPQTKHIDALRDWACFGIEPKGSAQFRQQINALTNRMLSLREASNADFQAKIIKGFVDSLSCGKHGKNGAVFYEADYLKMAFLFRSPNYISERSFSLKPSDLAILNLATIACEQAGVYLNELSNSMNEITRFVHAKNLSFNKINAMIEDRAYSTKFSIQFFLGKPEAEFPDWRFIDALYKTIEPMFGMRALSIKDYMSSRLKGSKEAARISAYDMDLIDDFLMRDPRHTLNQAAAQFDQGTSAPSLYKTYNRWKNTQPVIYGTPERQIDK